MKRRPLQATGLLLACVVAHAACAQSAPSSAPAHAPPTDHSDTHRAGHIHGPAPASSQGPTATRSTHHLLVHRSASCGCCGVWADHMRQAGFEVEERVTEDMGAVKQRVGLPYAMGSCHTAEIGGYFIEGHVPAEDVLRLLAERPKARGLTVPGMPIGSPGMEHPDGRVQPYAVLLVDMAGDTHEYARHGD